MLMNHSLVIIRYDKSNLHCVVELDCRFAMYKYLELKELSTAMYELRISSDNYR